MHRLTGHSGKASIHMSAASKQSIVPEYLPYVEPFFDLSTLAERLRYDDSVMLEYPVKDGYWHLAGKMKECLEKIQISGGNLQELIDDVLDISRIESGEFKIVSQAVKLPELFDFYCQAIAGMAEAEHIPIIALTANAYHEDIQKCLAAGMNAHLSKPINIDCAVRTIIECARTAKENG